jgi:hypothetical protein
MSELVTRLNAKTCRFDVGSGGTKEMTDQDIAAALGMVANKLGADVMCYLHWPDGIDRAAFEVGLLQKVRLECHKRAEEVVNAELRYMMHQGRNGTLRNLQQVTAGRSALWPMFDAENLPRYVRLVIGVLDEVASGPVCKHCNGRAKLATPEGVVECSHCAGSGRADESQRGRAARMGIAQPSFRERWDEPYRWLLSEVMGAWLEGSDQFRRALGRRNAA